MDKLHTVHILMYKKGMRRRPGRITRLANVLAFVVTIAVGIVFGYAWTVEEAVENKFKADKRGGVRAPRL
jgi:hypothetical protein